MIGATGDWPRDVVTGWKAIYPPEFLRGSIHVRIAAEIRLAEALARVDEDGHPCAPVPVVKERVAERVRREVRRHVVEMLGVA